MRQGAFPFLLPFAAIVSVTAAMLGIGALFAFLGHTGSVFLGLLLIVIALFLGYFLSTRSLQEILDLARQLATPPGKPSPSPIVRPIPTLLRHRIHYYVTEGPKGMVANALISVFLLATGMAIVYGFDIMNGVNEQGMGFTIWMSAALGVALVATFNTIIHFIGLDYREQIYANEEQPLIWHKD